MFYVFTWGSPVPDKKPEAVKEPDTKVLDYDQYVRNLEPEFKWKHDRCLDMGFGEAVSLILATTRGFDWHKAERMLSLGFDHRTVAREFL